MLLSEHERGLSHLKDKWMSSSALQQALINAGVNVFVNEHTEKFVSSRRKVRTCRSIRRPAEDRLEVPIFHVAILLYFTFFSTLLQDPLTEHAVYEQMALISSVCAFSWSKWNSKSGDEHLVVQVFYLLQLFKCSNALQRSPTLPHSLLLQGMRAPQPRRRAR